MKKRYVASVMAAVLAGIIMTSSAFAESMNTSMNMMGEVTIAKDIKVKVNGTAQDMMGGNGMMQYPLVYMGNVYLPIKGVSDALGIKINWDDASRSVMVERDRMMSMSKYNYAINIPSKLKDVSVKVMDDAMMTNGALSMSKIVYMPMNAKSEMVLATISVFKTDKWAMMMMANPNMGTPLATFGDMTYVVSEPMMSADMMMTSDDLKMNMYYLSVGAVKN